MIRAISSWRRDRRLRAMVRELKALSISDLGELGLARWQIDHLAREMSGIEHIQSHRTIVAVLAVIGLAALWVLGPAL